MARVRRLHLLIPTDKPAAPHMTSGVHDTGEPRIGTIGTGKSYRFACDPLGTLDSWNAGTGEWFAVACQACGQTPEFKHLMATVPHPRAQQPPEEYESMKGCCD